MFDWNLKYKSHQTTPSVPDCGPLAIAQNLGFRAGKRCTKTTPEYAGFVKSQGRSAKRKKHKFQCCSSGVFAAV